MNLLIHPLSDWLIKSLIVVILAFAVTQCMRRSSAARQYLVWLTALSALLLLPVSQLITPRWSYTWEKPEVGPVQPQFPLISTPAPTIENQKLAMLDVGKAAQTSETAAAPAISDDTTLSATKPASFPIFSILVSTWLVGGSLVIIHRFMGSLLLRRLYRNSAEVENDRIHELVHDLISESGITQTIEIRQSSACCVPLTWGLRSHVILLPAAVEEWPESRLIAALRHELGHIARHDFLTRLITTFICAFYWPNPLIWMAARSMRTAQEKACDDLVLNAGTSAEDYATLLFEAAKAFVNAPPPVRQAVAMAQPSTLETRITAIVEVRDRRTAGRRGPIFAAVGLAGLLLVSTTAQIRSADEKKSPESSTSLTTKSQDKPLSKTERKATALIVPRIMLVDATVKEAFDFLTKKSKEIDPEKAGINFVLKLPAQPAQPAAEIPGLSPALPSVYAESPKVTLALNNVPLAEVMRYICNLSGLSYTFEEHAIVITPVDPALAEAQKTAKDAQSQEQITRLINKLRQIIIPRIDLRDATLTESFEYLVKKTRDLDPERTGVNILVNVPNANTRITLALNDTPVYDAIKYVVNLANAKFEVEPHAIVVSNIAITVSDLLTAPSALQGRILSVNPGWNFAVVDMGKKHGALLGTELTVLRQGDPIGKVKISSVEANQSVADIIASSMTAGKKVEVGDTVIYTVSSASQELLVKEWHLDKLLSDQIGYGSKKYFVDRGIDFNENTFAMLSKLSSTLIVKNTEKNLAAIELLIKPHIVAKPPVIKSSAPLSFKEKVNTLILPRIDIKDATLKESLSVIQAQSKEIDPDQKGIEILWNVPKPDGAESRITLALNNVPVVEALRYVTNLTNTKLKIGKDAFSILPAGTPDEVFTKEFKLPSSFIAVLPGATASSASVMDARDFLIASGITFPEGGSASYDPGTSVLKITNTEENLDLLTRLIEITDSRGGAPAASAPPKRP